MSCHTSPFGEPLSARAEMAQQGACPEPWRCPSLALVPSMNGKEKKKSKKREWNEMRMSNHKPEALGARRRNWNNLEAHGAERRRSQKLKPWVSNQSPSSNLSQKQVQAFNQAKIQPKMASESRYVKGRQALEEKMWENEARKREGGGAFLNSQPWPAGWSLGQWSTVNGQHSNFLAFSCLVIVLALFSWNPQFLMSNAMRILIFGQNLTSFLGLFLYDAYDMNFTQS